MGEAEVVSIMRSWLFDLHRSGRSMERETEIAAERAAAAVVAAGGNLSQAFEAARATF